MFGLKKTFNLRVYGILINKKKEILVVKEPVAGKIYTKFPGGGLEFGEGIKECLIREFYEETQNEIKVNALYYLTEHFQVSWNSKNEQLISIYYLVKSKGKFKLNNFESDEDEFEDFTEPDLEFSWIPLSELDAEDFGLPIDKLVAEKIIADKNLG